MKKYLLAIYCILAIGAATSGHAQGVKGTVNPSFNRVQIGGNNGDIPFSFKGNIYTQSGFNYNPTSKVLSIDSVPLSNYNVSLTLDTATTDTAVLTQLGAQYIVKPTAALTSTNLLLPSSPSDNSTVSVKFTKTIATLSVLSPSLSVVYTLTSVVPGVEYKFVYDSRTTSYY